MLQQFQTTNLGAASKAHTRQQEKCSFVQHKARQPFRRCKVNDHFPGAASRAQHRAGVDIIIREKVELNRRKNKAQPKGSP